MRWCLLVLFGYLVLPAPAFAYRTYADLPELASANGAPIAWRDTPIALEIYEDDSAPVDAAQTQAALEAAIELWNDAPCTEGVFGSVELTDFAASEDGVNTVQWVHADWELLANSDAVATAMPVYERVDGEYRLVEADVFLNADTIAWSEELIAQLDGVLAHELGHVLGLAHPCEVDGANGAPRCGSEADSLMHPLYDAGRAALTSDDEDGACFLYAARPGTDEPKEEPSSGCVIGGSVLRSRTSPMLAWLLVGFAAMLVVRRAGRAARGK